MGGKRMFSGSAAAISADDKAAAGRLASLWRIRSVGVISASLAKS